MVPPAPAREPEETWIDSPHTPGARLSAWHLRGEGEALVHGSGAAATRPCVVMAHGFGGTKDSGLLPFAERFAEAGADVLLFDYRGFGTSDLTGDRRFAQDIDHRRHRQDYVAAVAHARRLAGVDPERVVLWGTSYSGGHVLAVAAADRRVRAVISQGAAVDGLAAAALLVRTSGPGQLLRLTGHAVRDLVATLARRPPHLVALHGPPGAAAVISAPGADEGFAAIEGASFRNEARARGVLRVLVNRPVRDAQRLTQPVLLVVAEADDVAPPSAVRRVARRAGELAEVLALDVGHFDIYTGAAFERSVAAQVDFLSRHAR